MDFAHIVGFNGDDLFDIQIAVGEALANAAEHAVHGGATRFDVRASIEGDALVIEVQDNGTGFDASRKSQTPPDSVRVRGYGTSIMRAVMDRVEYTFGGTCVRLVKRMPSPEFELLEDES